MAYAAKPPPKSLWHSEAVTFGPTLCYVKQGPKPSKNPDNPPYFVIDVGGRERYYNVENEQCEATLKTVLGRKAMLEFTGSRDQAAILMCGAGAQQPQGQPPDPEDDGRNEPPPDFANQPRPARTPAPQQAALPPAQQEAEDLKRGRHTMMQLANLLAIALDGAQYVAAAHAKKHPAAPPFTSDNICSLAATLCIGGERQGVQNLMPSHPLDAAPKGGGK